MMHVLLANLYNCREDGRIIHEVYQNNKAESDPNFEMCKPYFSQLLTLAK